MILAEISGLRVQATMLHQYAINLKHDHDVLSVAQVARW